jgi:hypothetical protein
MERRTARGAGRGVSAAGTWCRGPPAPSRQRSPPASEFRGCRGGQQEEQDGVSAILVLQHLSDSTVHQPQGSQDGEKESKGSRTEFLPYRSSSTFQKALSTSLKVHRMERRTSRGAGRNFCRIGPPTPSRQSSPPASRFTGWRGGQQGEQVGVSDAGTWCRGTPAPSRKRSPPASRFTGWRVGQQGEQGGVSAL